MAKLTVNPPSAEVVDKAASPSITDERGRVLTLKEPDVFAPFDLVEILGTEASANPIYMGMSIPVLYLDAIDGDRVFFSTKREFKALVQRLGTDGLKTLRQGVEQHFGQAEEEAEKAAVKK